MAQTTEKKVTDRENLVNIRTLAATLIERTELDLVGMDIANGDGFTQDMEAIVAYCDKKLAQLDNRHGKSKKLTEEQAGAMTNIYNALQNFPNGASATELVVSLNNEYSTPKVTSMLGKLITAGKVERIVEGKKVYFKVTSTTEE